MPFQEKFKRSNVGGVIYALRIGHEIGQVQLSKELGVSQGTISKIENGSLELGVSLYYNLLNYFDLSSNEFAELVDNYIRATLKAQKLKIHLDKQKELVSDEIGIKANLLRSRVC